MLNTFIGICSSAVIGLTLYFSLKRELVKTFQEQNFKLTQLEEEKSGVEKIENNYGPVITYSISIKIIY